MAEERNKESDDQMFNIQLIPYNFNNIIYV